jgi:hypothetical protein
MVKRWCGSAAAGTETARMNQMREWYPDGGDDQGEPYVRALDYDHAIAHLARLVNEVSALRAFEHEVRQAIGNTNWEVLMRRRTEAKLVAWPDGRESETSLSPEKP